MGARPVAAQWVASVIAIAAPPSAAWPQGLGPSLTAQVDAAVTRVLHEDHAPSASIAIVVNDHIAYSAAYGQARRSPPSPATTRTRYQLASLSKTLTAEALLLLEQDGKLTLDEPASRWISNLSGGNRVTVRQLLQHTTGFPDHYPQTYPAGPRTRPTTPDLIIAEWGRHPLLFDPGTRFRYSNFNYVIAGRIAEKAAGEPLFAFLQRRVFAPLKMTATIDLDDVNPRTPLMATGYVRPGLGRLEPASAEGRGWSFGAGQVVTTASDLARWDEAFLQDRLLAPKQAQEQVATPMLQDRSRSAYALGLFVAKLGGRTTYYNIGQGLGFLAMNRIYPAEHTAIVVLTNDSSSAAFSHIAQRLGDLVVPPTPQDAQALALFTAIQGNHLDRRQASPDFNAYFDSRMARAYADSLRPLGKPDRFDLHSEDEADGITTRLYKVSAGGRKLRVLEQLLSNGQIESFSVQSDD